MKFEETCQTANTSRTESHLFNEEAGPNCKSQCQGLRFKFKRVHWDLQFPQCREPKMHNPCIITALWIKLLAIFLFQKCNSLKKKEENWKEYQNVSARKSYCTSSWSSLSLMRKSAVLLSFLEAGACLGSSAQSTSYSFSDLHAAIAQTKITWTDGQSVSTGD